MDPRQVATRVDPDPSLPLPIHENRVVSLAERYAVLAVVWDVYWDGDEKLDPWPKRQHCRSSPMSAEEYARYKQEEMPGLAYKMLVILVEHTKRDARTDRLSEKDREIVGTWIAGRRSGPGERLLRPGKHSGRSCDARRAFNPCGVARVDSEGKRTAEGARDRPHWQERDRVRSSRNFWRDLKQFRPDWPELYRAPSARQVPGDW